MFFTLKFTAEEIQAVNEMERVALDKVSFTPFPFYTQREWIV